MSVMSIRVYTEEQIANLANKLASEWVNETAFNTRREAIINDIDNVTCNTVSLKDSHGFYARLVAEVAVRIYIQSNRSTPSMNDFLDHIHQPHEKVTF